MSKGLTLELSERVTDPSGWLQGYSLLPHVPRGWHLQGWGTPLLSFYLLFGQYLTRRLSPPGRVSTKFCPLPRQFCALLRRMRHTTVWSRGSPPMRDSPCGDRLNLLANTESIWPISKDGSKEIDDCPRSHLEHPSQGSLQPAVMDLGILFNVVFPVVMFLFPPCQIRLLLPQMH